MSRGLIVVIVCLLIIPAVSADFGPKPSTSIFVHAGASGTLDALYVAALSCERDGATEQAMQRCIEYPSSREPDNPYEVPYEVCLAFTRHVYEDNGCYWRVSDSWFLPVSACVEGVCHLGDVQGDRLLLYDAQSETTYMSHPIGKTPYTAALEANLRPDGAVVVEDATWEHLAELRHPTSHLWQSIIIALIYTLLFEGFVALAAFGKPRWFPLVVVFGVNLITVPLLHLCLWLLRPYAFSALLVGELFVVIAEFAALWVLLRERASSMQLAGVVLVMNLLSFIFTCLGTLMVGLF